MIKWIANINEKIFKLQLSILIYIKYSFSIVPGSSTSGGSSTLREACDGATEQQQAEQQATTGISFPSNSRNYSQISNIYILNGATASLS